MSKKPVYESKDGEKFDTPKEAERRDSFLNAAEKFELAVTAMRRAFRETAKTADGVLIDFGGWSRYWYVRERFGERPSVEEVRLWSFDVTARTDEHRPGIVFHCESHESNRGQRWSREYRADELYASEANAKRALLKVCEERLAEFTADVEALRKELAV